MLTVALKQDKYQKLTVTINKISYSITIQELGDNLYFSLSDGEKSIVENVLCLDRVYLIRYDHLPFVGDFFFVDTQGKEDPYIDGLGTRFLLIYKGELDNDLR